MKEGFCIITHRHPPEYSGAAKRALELAGYLESNSYPGLICTTTKLEETEKIKIYYRAKTLQKDKVSGFLPALFKKILFIVRTEAENAKENTALLKKLFKFRKQYGVIFIYGRLPLVAALMRLNGKKIIYRPCLMGYDDPGSILNERIYKRPFNKIILSLVDYFWCITEEIYDSAIKSGINKKKVLYIPNGVEVSKQIGTEKFDGMAAGRNSVIKFAFVGRPDHRKGVDRLLHNFRLISEAYPSSELHIFGPDSSAEEFRLLKNEKNVIYMGEVDNISGRLEEFHFFLFPSRKEGFPTSLIEAMSAFLIPLVPLNSRYSDSLIFDYKNGIFIDFENNNILDKLKPVLEDEALLKEISLNAFNFVRENYNRSVLFEKLISGLNIL